MATPNVGILTTAGKALIDKVNSGQAKISFSKVVFSSMDNSQLSDMQVKALTAISPQEVVVSSPETTLDTNSGETRIRATGTNEKLADGVYVKTYGVFAKDDTGNEILYGVTVSPNPNYFPAYDGVTPQAVTYSYKTVIQETSNITMTNSNDVYVSQEDLTEAIDKIPQPDLSNYATKDEVATKVDTSAMVNSDVYELQLISSGSANDLPNGTVFCINPATDLPNAKYGWTIRTTYSNMWGGRKTQIAISDTDNQMFYRTCQGTMGSYGDWISLANTDDVTTAISTATENMADTTKPTNFTDGLQSGGVDVATAADLKSIEDSAWRQLDNKHISVTSSGALSGEKSIFMYKIDKETKRIYFFFVLYLNDTTAISIDLSSVAKGISNPSLTGFTNYITGDGKMTISSNKMSLTGTFVAYSEYAYYTQGHIGIASPCFVTYDELL